MRIVIETKKTSEMRYDTLGDWFYRDVPDPEGHPLDTLKELMIQVDGDNVPDPREQFLIALHELVEVKLCEIVGISQQQVDHFDTNVFPQMPESADPEFEPGDHPHAPYRDQHRFAMLVEHLMAREMGLEGYGVVR